MYSNEQVRKYLAAFYLPTFRRGQSDFFYYWKNREIIALPINQNQFSDLDLTTLFQNTALEPLQELERFKSFTSLKIK